MKAILKNRIPVQLLLWGFGIWSVFGGCKPETKIVIPSKFVIIDTAIQAVNDVIETSDGTIYVLVCIGKALDYSYKVYKIPKSPASPNTYYTIANYYDLKPIHLFGHNDGRLHLQSEALGKNLLVFDTDFRLLDSITLNYGGLNPTLERRIRLKDGSHLFSGRKQMIFYNPYIVLTRFSSDMKLQWVKGKQPDFNKNYGSVCNKMIALNDGGALIFGSQSREQDLVVKDLLISKADANGDEVFRKLYGNDDYEEAHDAVDDGGGITVIGTKRNSKSGIGIWLLKCNYDGDTLFSKTIFSPEVESYFNLSYFTSNPQIFKVGDGYLISFRSSGFGNSIIKTVVMKLDRNYRVLSTNLYGGITGVGHSHMIQTSDSNFLLVISSRDFTDGLLGYQVEVIKVQPDGSLLK